MVRRRSLLQESIFFQGGDSASSGFSLEPTPMKVPARSTLQAPEPYPLFSIPIFSSTRDMADHVLDDAVNEIFRNDPMMEDTQDLDAIWDSTAFGETVVQDDTQLGFLLERLLED